MNKLVKVVATCIFFASSLVCGVAKSSQANDDTNPALNANKQVAPLVLKHAKDIFGQKTDGQARLAWHESHASHASHASHESHVSHYSGDYEQNI